jgi:hypothetical protein
MNCCNSFGQCTQGFNCPAHAQKYDEKDDAPPLGYCHDFLAMLAIWVLGIVLGIVGTILFLLG